MSENFYDTAIAPKLLEICELCKSQGIPFSATVEYELDARAETRFLPDGAGLAMTMLALVNHHGNNVDGFILNLISHCRRKGIDWSQSLVMRHLAGDSESEPEVHRE